MKVTEEGDEELFPLSSEMPPASASSLLPPRSRLPPIQRPRPVAEARRGSANCPDVVVPPPQHAAVPAFGPGASADDAPELRPRPPIPGDQRRLVDEYRIAERMDAMHVGGGYGGAGRAGEGRYGFFGPTGESRLPPPPPPHSLPADQLLVDEFRIAEPTNAMHVVSGYGGAGAPGEGRFRVFGPIGGPSCLAPGDARRIAGLGRVGPYLSSSSRTWPENPQASSLPPGAYSGYVCLGPMSNPPQHDRLDHWPLALVVNSSCNGCREVHNYNPVSPLNFSPQYMEGQITNLDVPGPRFAADGMIWRPGVSPLNGGAVATDGHDAQLLFLRDVEAFGCEDSLIIQGRGLHIMERNRRRRSYHYGHRSSSKGNAVVRANHLCSLELCWLSILRLDSKKCIYCIAKDHQGCQALQQMIASGTPQVVDAIYHGILNHVEELTMNTSAHHLMHDLLDACNEEQRLGIIVMLTRDPTQFASICVHPHGSRVVQRLIETLRTQQQIVLLTSTLKLVFLDLTMEPNGDHVIVSCLKSFEPEYNEFIFEAAARYCFHIATHQYGCCFLQHCMDHSLVVQREILLLQISFFGFVLATDAYGNYVVQYVLKLRNPIVNENLASLYRGNYVALSKQKFSSNVMEKCVELFGEEEQATIVNELLSVPRFELLLQDFYANYVIYSAIVHTKGAVRGKLVDAIVPYKSLRLNPHCKRIFSLLHGRH